jgi:hypothetical protein
MTGFVNSDVEVCACVCVCVCLFVCLFVLSLLGQDLAFPALSFASEVAIGTLHVFYMFCFTVFLTVVSVSFTVF